MSNLHGFDMFFIAIYFLILFGIAWWAARREKAVSSDYFLASRDVAWFAVGASLFASNIDRKSTRLNSSHATLSRMPSSA